MMSKAGSNAHDPSDYIAHSRHRRRARQLAVTRFPIIERQPKPDRVRSSSVGFSGYYSHSNHSIP